VAEERKKGDKSLSGKTERNPNDASTKGEDDEREQSEGVLNERLES